MNKKDALKRLNAIEKEQKELRKIIECEEEIDLFSITSYKEVCKALKQKEYTLNDFECDKMFAFKQIKQIEELYNQGWNKDWTNRQQYKYYPYFTVNNSGGLVFYVSSCNCIIYYGVVAFYKDKKTSDYIGKTFINIYERLK